jgi:hypothetical protein
MEATESDKKEITLNPKNAKDAKKRFSAWK